MLKICVSKENYVWSMVILGGDTPLKIHSGVQKVSPEPCGHVPCDSEVGGAKQSSSVIGTRRQSDKTLLN